jgi:hypothetical protein
MRASNFEIGAELSGKGISSERREVAVAVFAKEFPHNFGGTKSDARGWMRTLAGMDNRTEASAAMGRSLAKPPGSHLSSVTFSP